MKFTDAVKRAELAIKLKKKRDRLAARMKELEELVSKEKDLLSSGEYILHLALLADYKTKYCHSCYDRKLFYPFA